MKILIGLVLFLMAGLASAQTSSWKLVEVKDKSGNPVGYIYHSYAVGTQMTPKKSDKVATGLRLICSTKGDPNPIIAIYWDGTNSTDLTQSLSWAVDKTIFSPDTWIQEGKIVYHAAEGYALINALKNGRLASVAWWSSDDISRNVFFDVKDFNAQLSEFNTNCKTHL